MIYLSPYNSEWPIFFETEKRALLKIMEQYLIEIEHIGSTAIPGISAKPIIDIMIGVKNLSDIDSDDILVLEDYGYVYIQKYEDMMPYRRYFLKNNLEGVRTHQIHLVEINSDFWNKHLLFRNYLRSHPDHAKRYDKLKYELARKFTDTNQYARAKTEFCNEIHLKALILDN